MVARRESERNPIDLSLDKDRGAEYIPKLFRRVRCHEYDGFGFLHAGSLSTSQSLVFLDRRSDSVRLISLGGSDEGEY